MSHNTFGHLFRVTTWGESHGPAIGCVVDGCPPGLPLTEDDIQPYLDKRRPGQSRYTTQRQEADRVKILSGVFENADGVQVTTGTPISLMIENPDQRSKDYGEIKDKSQEKIYQIALDSQAAALKLLRPGVLAEEVHAAYAEVIQSAGYDYPFRCGRGTGFSYVEQPQLVVGDKTVLQPGMVLAVDGSQTR